MTFADALEIYRARFKKVFREFLLLIRERARDDGVLPVQPVERLSKLPFAASLTASLNCSSHWRSARVLAELGS